MTWFSLELAMLYSTLETFPGALLMDALGCRGIALISSV
jgi:hypothetical protein